MFVQNDTDQSDARRLRHRRRSRIGAGRLSVPRYQVQAQSRCGRSGFERLCKMQQCVQVGRHVGSIHICIKIPKVNDALRRGALTVFDELLPVFQRSRSQGKSVVAIELEMVSLRGDAAPGAQCAQSRNQFITHSRGLGEKKP